MSLRLNKLLARRGLGARRKCDRLIQDGHVRVNGGIVREPGTLVEPDRDRVEVDGRALPPPAELRYFVLNKPVGVISTLDDPEGRRSVRDLLPPGPRVFSVGRLDADTSGLLLLTNDGELAHRLMHPRYGVEKVYRAWIDRPATESQLARLRGGVEFEPGFVSQPARVRPLPADGSRGLVEIAIHEGRYRQVRRMFEAVGLTVVGLHRSAYGPLRLGPLARGMWRELSRAEVSRLREVSARPAQRRQPRAEYFSARRGLVTTRRAPAGEAHRPPRPPRDAGRPLPARRAIPERFDERRSNPGPREDFTRRAGEQGSPRSDSRGPRTRGKPAGPLRSRARTPDDRRGRPDRREQRTSERRERPSDRASRPRPADRLGEGTPARRERPRFGAGTGRQRRPDRPGEMRAERRRGPSSGAGDGRRVRPGRFGETRSERPERPSGGAGVWRQRHPERRGEARSERRARPSGAGAWRRGAGPREGSPEPRGSAARGTARRPRLGEKPRDRADKRKRPPFPRSGRPGPRR